jgi:serine/threonine protein kinase
MQDEDFLYLVLPYLPGGDLLTYLEDMGEKKVAESKAVHLFHKFLLK